MGPLVPIQGTVHTGEICLATFIDYHQGSGATVKLVRQDLLPINIPDGDSPQVRRT